MVLIRRCLGGEEESGQHAVGVGHGYLVGPAHPATSTKEELEALIFTYHTC